MIKRLLLFIAGIIVLMGLWLGNRYQALELAGALIFLVLGISMAIPGMGCAGSTPLTWIGMFFLSIAIVLFADSMMGSAILNIVMNGGQVDNLCQATIRDMNNTIVSNYTVVCP